MLYAILLINLNLINQNYLNKKNYWKIDKKIDKIIFFKLYTNYE